MSGRRPRTFILLELVPIPAGDKPTSGMPCALCGDPGPGLKAPEHPRIVVHAACVEEAGWTVPEAVWRFARVTEDTRAAGGAVGKILDGFEEVAAILRPRKGR